MENYLRHQKFPDGISTKGDKANFIRGCMYKGKRHLVTDKQRRIDTIHDVHQGLGNIVKAVAMSSHLGRTYTYQKVSSRFYWYTIVNDVADYIKGCDNRQKYLSMPKNVKKELKNIAVPSQVMKQIGVDICCLPSVDEFKYLIVCMDYFSKWFQVKPIHDKSAPTVAQFLYKLICRHDCFAIQINDQGREFVNEVADEIHSMTGTQQRVTSAYHSESNGLVQRRNRTIKNPLET